MQLARPDSVDAAVAALQDGAVALSGGTELVPLLREGLVAAETLVDVSAAVPRGISGRTIGAGTTLAELEVEPQVPQALREACAASASSAVTSRLSSVGSRYRSRTGSSRLVVRIVAPSASRAAAESDGCAEAQRSFPKMACSRCSPRRAWQRSPPCR